MSNQRSAARPCAAPTKAGTSEPRIARLKIPSLTSCTLQPTRTITHHAFHLSWRGMAKQRSSSCKRGTTKNVMKFLRVHMNFVLTRGEIMLITGLGRTETFALQQQCKLRSISNSACKSWFLLEDVLRCVAEVRGLPAPDQQSSELHARLVVSIRQKKKA